MKGGLLMIVTILFWMGLYSAIGNWIWLIMLSSGLVLVGMFYIILDKKP